MNLKKFSLILIGFYLLIFLVLPHTEYQPADPGIKIIQIQDFINSGYSTFAASYQGKYLDPDLKFFPTKPPFGYVLSGNAYYVFPFFVTVFYAPFYLLGGIYALDLLSLISGLVILYLVYKISILLDLSESFRKPMLIFISFGSINSIYSFMLGEAIHASLLITLAYFLILKAKTLDNSWPFFLSGVLSGLSVLFRIELALFCFLFFAGVLLFRIYKSKMDSVALATGFAIPALILIFANYQVTGNILGLRGIEFLNYSGAAYPFERRLFSLVKALFVSDKGLGLFTAWPVFLFLIPFFVFFKKLNSNRELNFLLFISIIFSILIPMIVKNDDGSILGPRFAASVQPLLVVGTFYSIDLLSKSERIIKWISYLKYIVYYSVFVTLLGYVILFLFLKTSHRMNVEIDKSISGELVIIKNAEFYSLVFPSLPKKPVLAIENSQELSDFFQKNLAKVPRKISIISSASTKDNDSLLPIGVDYEIENAFSKNGIVVQNLKIKNLGN
ncbi:MAG: hypothetical protein KBF99_03140 [Leptospiraceae bacterium]|nr:hypothetical protein [Leptospiraceae bacterium]MBL0265247.1 hypothetical protein [Leptospiraceae bacterium]MBP9162145.1 hypothetical protein [Leptospiraceae bacterium]